MLIDLIELSTIISSFLKLDNVYLNASSQFSVEFRTKYIVFVTIICELCFSKIAQRQR